MLKTSFAVAVLAVLVLAAPARAQSDSPGLLAEDDNACAAQGAGPGTDGYSDCTAQRKKIRLRQALQRAADLADMPKVFDPMPSGHQYLEPSGIHAMEDAPPARPEQTITTTRVCATEGDAANPQTICHTDVEISKKAAQATPPNSRNDPLSALAHTDAHPGDIMNDHTQY